MLPITLITYWQSTFRQLKRHLPQPESTTYAITQLRGTPLTSKPEIEANATKCGANRDGNTNITICHMLKYEIEIYE